MDLLNITTYTSYSFVNLDLVFVLNEQEVGAAGVGQEVKQSKDACGDVWAPRPVIGRRPGRQLHDEGDKVQGSGESRVDQLL